MNDIGADDAITFAEKLPRMKVLRICLSLGSLWLMERQDVERFLHSSMQNTSIERLDIYLSMPGKIDLVPKSLFGPMLNRAGRRYLGQNPGSLPLNLFPHVVTRATKICYYKPRDDWGKPSAKYDGLDAVLWLLRENYAVLGHIGGSLY
jgi:hypothetical protein